MQTHFMLEEIKPYTCKEIHRLQKQSHLLLSLILTTAL